MTKLLKSTPFQNVFLGSLGGALEYYDFAIFAIFAQSIGITFFPSRSSFSSLNFAFALLAIGYLSRPIGGLCLGHIGDSQGRKKSFCLGASLMAMTTLAVGLLPGFERWGYVSLGVFVVLRFIQGLSVGGEVPGAYTLVHEHAQKHTGKSFAILLVCFNSSYLLAQCAGVLLASYFDETQLHAWGWRIAFIAGGLLGLSNFYFRRKMSEPVLFVKQMKAERLPTMALMRTQLKNLMAATLLTSASAAAVGVYLLMFPSYLTVVVGLPSAFTQHLCLLQLVIFTVFSAAASILTDYLPPVSVLFIGAIYLAMTPLFVLTMIVKHHMITTVVLCNAVGAGFYAGAVPAFIVRLFPTKFRYTGMGVSYNLGFSIFGGLTPLLSSLMIHVLAFKQAPAIIVTFCGLLALLALISVLESSHIRTHRSKLAMTQPK